MVVDEGGGPLPGAHIKLLKTEHSAVTDVEGNFSITLLNQSNPVLTVSYLGMTTQNVKSYQWETVTNSDEAGCKTAG